MTVDFSGLLTLGLERLEIPLASEKIDSLSRYFAELLRWAAKVNLVAKTSTPEDIIENHFLDSLVLLPFVSAEGDHLLDIGSGAGFPGLVCKTARPELAVTLVEPRQKRAGFLRHVGRLLGLADLRVLECRVEDEKLFATTERFTHITGRAVAEIAHFLPMVERFAPSDPQIICMKGPRWQKEMAEAEQILDNSPYKLHKVVDYRLPFSEARRSLLFFTI